MKQLVKRLLLPPGKKIRRIRGGVGGGSLMWINLHDQLQRCLGLDERELLTALLRLSEGAQTLIDVGANDGLYTIHFLASRAELIIACEPGDVGDQLKQNAAVNGHQLSPRFKYESRLIGNGSGEVSLTELLREAPLPVFIKVDVDGVEDSVLASAANYEHLDQVSWLVETHSLVLEETCRDWFHRRPYQTTIVFPAWWRRLIPEKRPPEHNRWLLAEYRR